MNLPLIVLESPLLWLISQIHFILQGIIFGLSEVSDVLTFNYSYIGNSPAEGSCVFWLTLFFCIIKEPHRVLFVIWIIIMYLQMSLNFGCDILSMSCETENVYHSLSLSGLYPSAWMLSLPSRLPLCSPFKYSSPPQCWVLLSLASLLLIPSLTANLCH